MGMTSTDFVTSVKQKALKIDETINSYLPKIEGYQKTVIDAMHYSMMAGGKRIRAILMQETFLCYGGKNDLIKPFLAAMEMIHTYSLIHDDLPAMDNDEYRRGRKTTHIVYGEGMGVLAGDALLNYAFETAISAFGLCKDEKEKSYVMNALTVLSQKAGIFGMIGGQTADVEAEEQENVAMEQLLFIHEHKTAALIEASFMIGAILAGACEEDIRKMEACGSKIGIAFQIQDDILDIIGDEKELGKKVGSDEKNHKQTYVTISGMNESKEEVYKLSMEAIEILQKCPGDSQFLQDMTKYLIYRNK